MGGEAPLTLVHDRPVVSLDDGVRGLVDTGARALMLSQALADSLGLAVIETVEEGGEVFTVLEPPAFSIGGYDLDTDGLPAYGFEDTRAIGLAASGLDLLLPAALVGLRHAMVLDPVDGSAWFGPPGSLSSRSFGVRVPAVPSAAADGLCAVSVEVLGQSSWLLLDTGLSCSLVASSVMTSWSATAPSIPAAGGCVGPGNMAGLRVEARSAMVRAPMLVWGGGEFSVPGVAFVVRGDRDVAPYDGSLGGNVLRSFRLGIDLGAGGGDGDVFVEQRAPVLGDGGGDTDQVGVTLVLDDEGEWEIGAAITGLGDAGVAVGDRLVAVEGQPVTGVPIGDVLTSLRARSARPSSSSSGAARLQPSWSR